MEKKYKHLGSAERDKLHRLLANGSSQIEIAKELGVARSTISRELKRNWSDRHNGYMPDTAHANSQLRRKKIGSKIERSKDLQKQIENYLAMEWSPKIIAGRLKLELGNHIISHESIYKWLYGSGYDRQLWKLLHRKKPKRGRRPCSKGTKSRIPNRVSIDERPKSANQEFGHWELDTVFFAKSQGCILTLIEKQTRFLIGAKMHTRTKDETTDMLSCTFGHIPAEALKSLTFDNGSEFTDHQILKDKFKVPTYFCDPYSPWQKGAIENGNGLIRRAIPKGARAEEYSARHIQEVIHQINGRPRESLGFKTPYEAYLQKCNQSVGLTQLINPFVALQN